MFVHQKPTHHSLSTTNSTALQYLNVFQTNLFPLISFILFYNSRRLATYTSYFYPQAINPIYTLRSRPSKSYLSLKPFRQNSVWNVIVMLWIPAVLDRQAVSYYDGNMHQLCPSWRVSSWREGSKKSYAPPQFLDSSWHDNPLLMSTMLSNEMQWRVE